MYRHLNAASGCATDGDIKKHYRVAHGLFWNKGLTDDICLKNRADAVIFFLFHDGYTLMGTTHDGGQLREGICL